MHESKQRVRALARGHEDKREMPTLLFHFQPSQLILKHHRRFTKVDARTCAPFGIRRVLGVYCPQVTIKPVHSRGRPTIIHASHLVPFKEPYMEPQTVELGMEGEVELRSP